MKRRTFIAGCMATAALGSSAAAGESVVLAASQVFPLLYRADQGLAGFLFDVVVEAGRRAGFAAEIRVLPWARCLEEARTGEIDGVFAAFRTAERETYLTFPAEPLMSQRICFFTRKDSSIRYTGLLADLARYRIGIANKVSYGPAFDAALRDGVLTNIELANGAESLVRMLLASRVDLFVLHDMEVIGLLNRLGLSDAVKMLAPPLDEVPGYIAFTRERDLSRQSAAYDAALAGMKRDGAYRRRYEAYFL